jgi:hypothetical protein
MSDTTIQSLDASEITCPEFSLSARLFLDEVPEGGSGHIVTREKMAEARLTHICSVYGWDLIGPSVEDDMLHFMINKP